MSQDDYIILFDEDGSPYIAHAGLDGLRNFASNAASTVSNAVKGVGRGVRQNHKYILKVFENGRNRYFYKQEEVKAYYDAKRKGIKNPAEYAQKAAEKAAQTIDDKTRDLRTATSRAVTDTAQNLKDRASDIAEKITGSQARKNLEASKRASRDATNAAESYTMRNGAPSKELDADARSAKRSEDFNQFLYDKSLRGQAEKAADSVKDATSSAFNQVKNAANNAVSNAKTQYDRMRNEFRERTGANLKERAQTAEQEAQDAEAERRKAAGKFSSDVDRDLASRKALDKNPNSAHAQAERDQAVAAVRKSGEEYYKEGGALDTAQKTRAEAAKAREEYDDFKDSHSLKAMIDKARSAVKDTAEKASDSAKDMVDKARTAVKDTAEKASDSVKGMSDKARDSVKDATTPKTAKSEYGEYDSKDPDFDDKHYSDSTNVGDTDFYTFKRDDGRWVILEEDMKWVLPEGVRGDSPEMAEALTKFDRKMEQRRNSGERYTADEWTEAATKAIDAASQNTAGRVKNAVDTAVDTVKDTADKARDSVKDMLDRARKAISSDIPTKEPTEDQNAEERHTPERNWENVEQQAKIRTWDDEQQAKVRTWDDVDREVDEHSYSRKPDPINSSGARNYDTLKQDAREAGIDFTAYAKASSNAEKLARQLMKEYKEANEAPGPKSLFSRMWYEDPRYKDAVEQKKKEEEKLVEQLYY